MSQAIVEEVKAALEARGVRVHDGNCGAFAITARVAFRLKDQGARLILKRPEQNGCTYNGVRYSHDAIAFPDQQWKDCLAGAGPPDNQMRPIWDPTPFDASAALADPFDLDAPGSTAPPRPAPVDPGPEAIVDWETLNAYLKARVLEGYIKLDDQHQAALQAIRDVDAHVTALELRVDDTGTRMRTIADAVYKTLAALKKAGATSLAFRKSMREQSAASPKDTA